MVVAKHDVVAAKIHYIPVVTLVTIEGGKPVPANRDNGSSKLAGWSQHFINLATVASSKRGRFWQIATPVATNPSAAGSFSIAGCSKNDRLW